MSGFLSGTEWLSYERRSDYGYWVDRHGNIEAVPFMGHQEAAQRKWGVAQSDAIHHLGMIRAVLDGKNLMFDYSATHGVSGAQRKSLQRLSEEHELPLLPGQERRRLTRAELCLNCRRKS